MEFMKPEGLGNTTAGTWLRFFFLLTLPLTLAGCASARGGKLIDYDPEQTYAYTGTLAGRDISGVIQFHEDGYQIRKYGMGACDNRSLWQNTGVLDHLDATVPQRPGSNSVLDLRCGSLRLRLWFEGGQLRTEGEAAQMKAEQVRRGMSTRMEERVVASAPIKLSRSEWRIQ